MKFYSSSQSDCLFKQIATSITISPSLWKVGKTQ